MARLTKRERRERKARRREERSALAPVIVETIPPLAAAEDPRPQGFKIPPEVMAWSRRKTGAVSAEQVFTIPRPPKGVVPARQESRIQLAMDAEAAEISIWAAGTWASGWFDGPLFMGYPALSLLAALPEYRRMAEVLATECTRKWIRLAAGDGGDEAKAKMGKITALEAELKRLDVRGALRRLIELDAFFGRAHLFIDVGADPDDRKELVTSIGNGRNGATVAKFKDRKGFLRGVKPIEPVWCYPSRYNATNPLKDDWYAPQTWFCQGQEIHVSRLLRFVGREVPDLLKPAYMFGGVSLSQLMKPYVDRWISTVQAVVDIIVSFSTSGVKTNLEAVLKPTGGGPDIFERAELFSNLRTNRGMMLLDKDSEEFFQFNTPLSELEALMSKMQELMCVAGDTLVETDRGQVPITEVTKNDKVMTRQGWAPIEWVGQTGYSRDLIEISTANSTLRVTPCHPIFSVTTNEFVPARNVGLSHILAEAPTWPTRTGHPFSGAGIGTARATTAIGTTPRSTSFTGRFGERIAAQFRKVTTFITSMRTRATTIGRPIWNFSPALSTCVSMASPSVQDSPSSRRSSAFAWFAEQPFSRLSARVGALLGGEGSRSTVDKPVTLRPTAIVSLKDVTTPFEPVYNLKVADGFLPEFFANGILTHNCSISGEPVVKLLGIQPAGLNACLPAHTLILTGRGEIPICDVTVSDTVMTRKGWAPLTFAGITKHATELFEIRTADAILQCTANHPIWVSSTNAFVRAENVRPGDRLLLTGAKSAAQNTRRRSRGSAAGGGNAQTDIIPPGIRELSEPFSFIGRCGKAIAGRSLAASTSIISTTTKRIINSPILSPFGQMFTPHTTTLTFGPTSAPAPGSWFARNAGRISPSPNFRAGESFVPAPAYSPTGERTERLKQSRPRSAFAACVENLSPRFAKTPSSARAAVQRPARTEPNTNAHTMSLTRKNSSERLETLDVPKSGRGPRIAPIAGWISCQLAPLQSFIARSTAKIARRNCDVLSIRKIRTNEPVYDLTVAEGYLPEFFANGILTHNSSEGEITSWLDWVEAFREKFCAPHLTTIIDFAQLSLFGEVDPDITWTWENLRSLDAKEETERRKVEAETDGAYIEMGAFSSQEIRAIRMRDPESPYYGIDEIAPDAEGPEGAAMVDPDMAAEFPDLAAPPAGSGAQPDTTGQEDPRTAGRRAPGQPARLPRPEANPARAERTTAAPARTERLADPGRTERPRTREPEEA